MLHAQQNSSPQKYALVIGNGNYTGITRLRNPENDAADMKAALEGLGWTVDLVQNGDLERMEAAAERLKNRLSVDRESYGLFFYAGHGVQAGGDNYLIPVDAVIQNESQLRQRAVSVQALLDNLNTARNVLNVVVLDACRDNPFGWSRNGSRGLVMVANQPADSIIVYAAAAGQRASDGAGRNGLFTSQLLKHIHTPGIEIREMFRLTRADVRAASGNEQLPALYDQFDGLAYLGGRPAASSGPATPPPPVVPPPAPAPQPAPVRPAPVRPAAPPPERPVPLSWIEHSSWVNSAVYSPDGTRIVSASDDNTVRVWNATTGRLLLTLSGHSDDVNSAAYSPDGTRIVSASNDNTVKVWNAATGRLLLTLSEHSSWVNSAVYSPDGTRIVSASSDDTVKVWDAATGRRVRTLSGHSSWVNSAVYSPDGTRIVSASDDNTVRVWNAATGRRVRTLSGHSDRVHSAVYSPDGTRIVSASRDNTMKVWDAATGNLIRTSGHLGPVLSAAYSPDGTRIVSASTETRGMVRVWDAATGRCVRTLSQQSLLQINSAAYSPGGTRIVSTGFRSGFGIRVWDPAKEGR